MSDNRLFKIDALVVDGAPLAFEDGSATLSNVLGYESSVVPSASGDDYTSDKRVPRMIKAKMMFDSTVDPASMRGKVVQITGRDRMSGRRVLLPKCTLAKLGDIGGGTAVDVEWSVLAAPQWL